MATHDYVIANGTGAAVRADINNALAAVVSNNSNGSDPSPTFAYQWYVDTGDNTLYLRNAANNAWVAVSAVGAIGSANLGLAPAASPTITGTADFDSNTAIKVCEGTTAQRPGSPAVGMFRYNTTTNAFEGYSGSSPAWGEIGGSGGGATGGGTEKIFWENEKEMNTSYEISGSGANNAGVFGPLTVASGVSLTVPSGTTLHII